VIADRTRRRENGRAIMRSPELLQYQSTPASASTRLAMTEIDGVVTITFPVPAKWAQRVSVASQFLFLINPLLHSMLLIWICIQMHSMFHGPPSLQILFYLACYVLLTLLISLFCAHQLMMYLRWGAVPRVLKAADGCLTLHWLGFLRMGEKSWKAEEIRSIKCKTARDVFGRKAIYRIQIFLRSGWRRQILMSTRDLQVATDIQDSLHRVLRLAPP
jgi:hypothetical protein